jgi:hypothetical protein
VCKSCGGDGEQVVYNYCKSCVAAHTRGDMPLGGCQGCDIMADQQADLEEKIRETPPPGT